MKKAFYFFVLLSLHNNAYAQTKKLNVPSSIENVTVFLQGAQITRTASTTIPSGTTTLVFPGISPELEEKSIQVQGKGAFTILSVSREKNYMSNQQKPREELVRLQAQAEILEEKLQRERNRESVFKQEEEMLKKNQDLRGTATGLKTADLKEALDFQRNRLTEVLDQLLAIQGNIRQINDQVRLNDLQRNALMQQKDSSVNDLLVTVSSKENITGKLTLRYLVKNAGWYPSYELRVENISRPMELAYKANVFQQCGEDWKNVKLSLSSGNPSENGQKPELNAWYLRTFSNMQELLRARSAAKTDDIGQVSGTVTDPAGRPITGATIRVPDRTIGTSTNEKGEFALQVPPGTKTLDVSYIGYMKQSVPVSAARIPVVMFEDTKALNEVVVVGYDKQQKRAVIGASLEGKTSGIMIRGTSTALQREDIPLDVSASFHTTSVNFDIVLPYTILSDGKPYAVAVSQNTMPTSYEYHAAPKLDAAAYLIAGVTGWEELNLLEGEASIYFEGTYLGKSLLNLQSAADTLYVSLGRDKNIVINRKLQKQYSKNQFLGGNQTSVRNWEISVRNNKQQPIRILVEDQVPMAAQGEVEVSRVSYAGASLNPVTQLVTWSLDVPVKEEKKMQLQYTVKYPKDKLVNLD
ncbi:mucoidy inhibitor MuiA family protein [Chitinophaga sp. GCM10012297]|uniref:Mucoidy inhibitor MuiA family protein n=1 Tax=Chitinophaga chungangae TaxID=2821488 RepID=A0ABS3YLD3_9BACT|nr:DUF4139 domain-containing protein [Chitinophaga chungangae]MBO9155063.1 mucoidy inhibitor MuiA family protein [Chitinophaga chungangae]